MEPNGLRLVNGTRRKEDTNPTSPRRIDAGWSASFADALPSAIDTADMPSPISETSTSMAGISTSNNNNAERAGVAAGGSPTIKPRVRISKACVGCRKVKLKCNGKQPCSRCSALHMEPECDYTPSLRGKTRRRRSDRSRSGAQDSGNGEGAPGRLVSRPTQRPLGEPSTGDKRARSVAFTADHTYYDDAEEANGAYKGEHDKHEIGEPWKEGRVMKEMQRSFARWKHNDYLTHAGPQNANLWSADSLRVPAQDPIDSPSHTITSFSPGSFGMPANPLGPDPFTTLPLPGDAPNPLGMLAEASASAGHDISAESRAPSPSPFAPTCGPGQPPQTATGGKGKVAKNYYLPLERVLKHDAPHIMSLISIHEAEQLFETYYKLLHPHMPFLDRAHSTPAALAQRGNFLFNAICCVAARATNPMLWQRLKEFAAFEMERLPRDKTIDIIQGHLIYSAWNVVGPTSFEEDKSWLRIGLALRTGIDINLHRVALSKQAREGLPNWLLRMILRTWLLSFVIDRTLCAQLGKPITMRGEHSFQIYADLLASPEYRKSVDDVWVASLAEYTQILSRVHDVFSCESAEYPTTRSISSQSTDMVYVFVNQFRQWAEKSTTAVKALGSHDEGMLGVSQMVANVGLFERYARLVTHSFGLQRANDHRKTDLPSAFAEYQSSASRLIELFESDYEGVGYTRGCPDYVFTILTFAAVSLLKGTEAHFSHLQPNKTALTALARKASGILSRSATAADHLPAIQHSLLTRLINYTTKMANVASPSSTSNHPPATMAPSQLQLPMSIDFEAFGLSIDADLTKAPWPPVGFPSGSNTAAGLEFDFDLSGGNGSTLGLGSGMSTGLGMNDFGLGDAYGGFGWLTGGAGVSGAVSGFGGMGLGTGTVAGTGAGTSTGNDADTLFGQDTFWNSIIENGGV